MSYRKIKIAIHQDKGSAIHTTSWSFPWIQYCKDNNISYTIINCYDYKIIEELKNFDILLWHFNNYSYNDMHIARSILYTAKSMGVKVFPDFDDSWHFDDKIAETYIMQSINSPIPRSWMFYKYDDLKNWIDHEAQFPIIAKLRCGSGSHNVKLIKEPSEMKRYARRMFNKGFSPIPSFRYKATSNLKSSKSVKDIKSRLKRLPEFMRTLSGAKEFPNEKGYVYLQEFTPNDGFDLKIVVVGDKLSFIGRNIRKGDFRASGGGDLFYDREVVSKDIIDSAFETSDRLGFQCMGYDYIVDKRTDKGVIVEISYGFSHSALLQAGGYWDRKGNWINESLNAPIEIIKNCLLKMENNKVVEIEG